MAMTARRTQERFSPRAAGFTLVELLVVIGIIIILIGILLPVVSSARKTAYATDSANQVKNIANAIDRYYTDFAAYPGVFSNTDITAGVSASAAVATGRKVTGLTSNLTMTENCVLALCGGLTGSGATLTTTGLTYTSTDIGRGPLNFNAVQQKRYSSYLEASPQILSLPGSSLNPIAYFGTNGDYGVNTGVPEFIDRFPDAMPIIYLRAKVGASGIYDNATDTTQYDYAHIGCYTTSPTLPANAASQFQTNVNANISANGVLTAGLQAYFGNASLSTSTLLIAKRKDTYMLISAGKDRIYGTADDICNFDLQ